MITLDKKEKEIFRLLLDVASAKSPNTIIRAAGGYVRDKLLGLKSYDIDIAVSNMSGEEFANLVKKYMDENNIHHKGEISVVKANPDQSKHLATAMLNIFGVSIDFANLRKEDYAHSRIPIIQPGTAEEDAARRDLTINALFYNINEGKLEDFVGGLKDLKNKIAKTPIDPVQTFIDDPLRMLRVIRFAAKYNLYVVPEIIEAAKLPEVQAAFNNKISKERVWREFAGYDQGSGNGWKPGFMSGPNPVRAIKLLNEFGLRDILFGLSEDEIKLLELSGGLSPFDADQNSPHHDLTIWNHTVRVIEHLINNETTPEQKENAEDYLVRNLSALFHDIGKCDLCSRQTSDEGHYTYHGHEDSSAKITKHILLRMKAPLNIIDRVVSLVQNHMRLHLLASNASSKALRRFLRDLGNDWINSVDLSIADAYGKDMAKGNLEIRSKYDNFAKRMRDFVIEMGGKTEIKPPINGHDLMAIGFLPGPKMGQILKILQNKLLENPAMKKEEALEFVVSLHQPK